MSRVVFAMTEAQYQAIVDAYAGRAAEKRQRAVSIGLERRGFLVRDWDHGPRRFKLARAGAAIIELGLALQDHQAREAAAHNDAQFARFDPTHPDAIDPLAGDPDATEVAHALEQSPERGVFPHDSEGTDHVR